jgi:hypothetical protein
VKLSGIVIRIVCQRANLGVPIVPTMLLRSLHALIQQPDKQLLSVADLTSFFNRLHATMIPRGDNRPIVVTSCPLVGNEDEVRACKVQSASGCDACAGHEYYAKTNGHEVWVAAEVFKLESRVSGEPIEGRYGPARIDSLTLFIVLHEFCHVMQQDASTERLFDTLKALYNNVARLLAPYAARIKVSDDDALEAIANIFAYENARSALR